MGDGDAEERADGERGPEGNTGVSRGGFFSAKCLSISAFFMNRIKVLVLRVSSAGSLGYLAIIQVHFGRKNVI